MNTGHCHVNIVRFIHVGFFFKLPLWQKIATIPKCPLLIWKYAELQSCGDIFSHILCYFE